MGDVGDFFELGLEDGSFAGCGFHFADIFAAAGDEVPAEEFFAEGVEFELREEGPHRVAVEGLHGEVVEGLRDGDVEDDGGELFGEEGLRLVLLDAFLEFALQLVGIGEEVLHGIKFAEEFLGGLFADSGDAGDVVGGVAHEAEDIDDLRGSFHAPDFAHAGEVDDIVFGSLAAGFPHVGALVDELGEVLVGSDHERFDVAACLGLGGEGADDVVGLETVEFEDGDVEGLAEAFEVGEGGGEILGHGVALGLVFRIEGMSGGGGGGVEGDGQVGGLLVLQNPKRAEVFTPPEL